MPVMAEDGLRWPTMGAALVAALVAAFVDLLSGVIDFSTVDAFEMVFENGFILVLMNLNGANGGRGTERTDSFKQIFSFGFNIKDCFGCIGNFATHARF